jgi:hypothetical protein
VTPQDIVSDCGGYGVVLGAWCRDRQIVASSPSAPQSLGRLRDDDARKFVLSTYALVRSSRPLTIYRLSETQGLKAPYGREHASYQRGLVAQRNPATSMGRWWSPFRPSLLIDGPAHGSDAREDVRRRLAVLLKWNRCDLCLEGQLPAGEIFYAGRTEMQREDPSYATDRGHIILYAGGAMQFLLTSLSNLVVRDPPYRIT